MIPIPNGMLPHKATLQKQTGMDGWQKPSYSAPIPLTNVKIDPFHAVATDSQSRRVQLNATLFYDCRTSRPHGIRFEEGQRVVFGGRAYTVQSVDILYANSAAPHHYEVGLA